MRTYLTCLSAAVVWGVSALAAGPLAADEFKPEGRWVLVLPISFSDELGRTDRDFSIQCLLMLQTTGVEVAIVDVVKGGDGYESRLVDAFPPEFREPEPT